MQQTRNKNFGKRIGKKELKRQSVTLKIGKKTGTVTQPKRAAKTVSKNDKKRCQISRSFAKAEKQHAAKKFEKILNFCNNFVKIIKNANNQKNILSIKLQKTNFSETL